jgi:hypothetical protein
LEAYGREKPLTSSPQSKREEEKGDRDSIIFFKETHSVAKGPPTRPNLLKVPPPPNSTTLGNKPPKHDLWGTLIQTIAVTLAAEWWTELRPVERPVEET